MKTLFAMVLSLVLAHSSLAESPAKSLRKQSICCYESLFRQGFLGCLPVGPTHGTILYACGKHPNLKARLQGTVWKGKTFHCDGTFTNRWLGGIKAVSARVCIEPSWLDGQNCLVMQYPADARVFGNVRDEMRQIAPDLWVGHSYDAATGETKNWFILQSR